MSSDQRWKLAGIVSVVSLGGVLVTDIAANVVSGYISDQIKATWQLPGLAPGAKASLAPNEAAVARLPVAPGPERQARRAPAMPNPPAELENQAVATRGPLQGPEARPEMRESPESLPAPSPQMSAINGKVERVIDTGTLRIEGETIGLAGLKGLGSPYSDQLAKFIEEQGSKIRCMPRGERYTCFVKTIDLGLAALTNGAARLADDATPQYEAAEHEARQNRRGIFQ
jgi:penicillin-binding protein 1A